MSRPLGARVNKSRPAKPEIMRGSLNLFAHNDWEASFKKIDCLTRGQKRRGPTLRLRKVGFEVRSPPRFNSAYPIIDIPSCIFIFPKFMTFIEKVDDGHFLALL